MLVNEKASETAYPNPFGEQQNGAFAKMFVAYPYRKFLMAVFANKPEASFRLTSNRGCKLWTRFAKNTFRKPLGLFLKSTR